MSNLWLALPSLQFYFYRLNSLKMNLNDPTSLKKRSVEHTRQCDNPYTGCHSSNNFKEHDKCIMCCHQSLFIHSDCIMCCHRYLFIVPSWTEPSLTRSLSVNLELIFQVKDKMIYKYHIFKNTNTYSFFKQERWKWHPWWARSAMAGNTSFKVILLPRPVLSYTSPIKLNCSQQTSLTWKKLF